ncbi:unnamed protein product, partial [Closterium sp. NIES-54]
ADQPTDPGVTPWERAGWWNVLTFQWINPLLAKGHEKPLDLPDIPFLADWDTADAAREAFYRTWDRIRLYTPLQQPSITWTLWLTYWRKFLAIAFWAGLETVLLYIGPSLLAEFVRVVGGDVPVLTFGGGGAAEICAAGVAGDAGAGGGSCSSSTGTWNVDLAGPLAALGTSLTGAFGLTGLFGSAASAASAVSAASVASAASAAASNLTATAQTIASATSAMAAAAASSAAAFVTQTAATAAAAAAVPAAAAAAAAPAPSPGAPPDDPWAQWEGYWLCGVRPRLSLGECSRHAWLARGNHLMVANIVFLWMSGREGGLFMRKVAFSRGCLSYLCPCCLLLLSVRTYFLRSSSLSHHILYSTSSTACYLLHLMLPHSSPPTPLLAPASLPFPTLFHLSASQEPLRSFPDVLSSISQALVSLDRLAR